MLDAVIIYVGCINIFCYKQWHTLPTFFLQPCNLLDSLFCYIGVFKMLQKKIAALIGHGVISMDMVQRDLHQYYICYRVMLDKLDQNVGCIANNVV
jgi:hypothetical protein